jgi:hypothetical protein
MNNETKTNSIEARRLANDCHSAGLTMVEKYRQTWVWKRLRSTWVGDFVRGCRGCPRQLWAWLRCQSVVLPDVQKLTESLAVLHPQVPDGIDGDREREAPIFLLSTGWRAGSTLLQRILVTDPRLLLWGEPLGEMTIASRIAEIIGDSISSRSLREWKDQRDPASPGLSTSWIANLYPPSSDFRLALRSLFDQWLREPARQRGFDRWGFKEVRLGATEACLLHWLYPNAKFVIISRHPYDAYRSLADAGWGRVYYRYPGMSAESAAGFARHWNRLAVSWSHLPAGFPSVHIKYEDLIDHKIDFRKLESWLGIEIRENVALSVAVGSTAKRVRLSWYERMIIAREAAEGMRALGYSK